MGTHLIDSNVVIEFLGGMLQPSGNKFIQSLIEDNRNCISIINRIELLSYNGSNSEMQILNEFIEASYILNLNEEIVLKTIEIRKQSKIKLPDAIIASTAIVHQLALITRNIADFKNINDLSIVDTYLL
jgi:predicted nucleic acid-binding protein